MRGWWAGIAAALVFSLVPGSSRAEGLELGEIARLEAGHTVVRPQTIDRTSYDSGGRLIGGLAYTIVDSTPDELLTLLDDTSKWQELLPRTKSAKVVKTSGADTWVELSQGSGIMSATDTLHLRRCPREHMIRFWLDTTRSHAIDDAWGFFRAEALADGRTLLTFGVLIDTGPGIVRSFYEERLRAAMLNVPQVVRQYVLRAVKKPSAPT